MKAPCIALLLVGLVASAVFAADDPDAPDTLSASEWYIATNIGFTVNQSSYSDNWDGSEVSAYSWAFDSRSLAQKRITPNVVTNKSTLRLAFGQTRTQDNDTREWEDVKISTDVIDLESLFGFNVGWPVGPYGAVRIESDFYDDSDPTKTRYFNPTTFTESAGFFRDFFANIKTKEFSIRLGLASRQYLNASVLDTMTGTRSNDWINDAGVEFITELRYPFSGDLLIYGTRLWTYKALQNSDADEWKGTPEEDYWEAVEVDWEHSLGLKLSELFALNFYLQFKYDKKIVDDWRVKQTLGVAFTWRV
jgi:hypothetical protein